MVEIECIETSFGAGFGFGCDDIGMIQVFLKLGKIYFIQIMISFSGTN